MLIPEILAPAGGREQLEAACLYGADAVYLGVRGPGNLRAGARNFALDDLSSAVAYAHDRGVRVHVTLNAYPHDHDLEQMGPTIEAVCDSGADAVICADLGVIDLVREMAPELPIHLSTQANTVNTRTVRAWERLGITRVILARELHRDEIRAIRENCAAELEMFVHGSVCMSISGRCVISDYLAHRGANQGRCTQPCRWDYALVERTREGQYLPVAEEDGHTFLYNSRDLCLLPCLDEVLALGLDSLKIEGRNKTALSVATVVNAYRHAVDDWKDDPENFTPDPAWLAEVHKASNRGFFTGFFHHQPDQTGMHYDWKGYLQSHHLAAKIHEVTDDDILLQARNPLIEGMELEHLSPDGRHQTFTLQNPRGEDGPLTHIRPNEWFRLRLPFTTHPGELIRKPWSEGDKVTEKN